MALSNRDSVWSGEGKEETTLLVTVISHKIGSSANYEVLHCF